MAKHPLLINLDKKTFEDLHKVMGKTIELDGITIYRLFDDTQKQPIYRKILRAGIEVYLKKFEKEKTKREHEASPITSDDS
jgi:hypothetical protein